jgi:hypothetical protein
MKKIFLIAAFLIVNGLIHSHAQTLKGDINTEAMTNKIWLAQSKRDSIVVSKVPYGYIRVMLLDASRNVLGVTYTDSDGKYMFENIQKGKGKYILQVFNKKGEKSEIPTLEKTIYIKYNVNYLRPITIK